MSKRMKKLIPLLTAAVLGLSSCSFESSLKGSVSRTTRISFSWWGKDVRHSYTVDALADFAKQHPEIDVVARYSEFDGYRRRIAIDYAAGNNCDVMLINYDWLEVFSPDGEGFYDMYELSDQIKLDNFSKEDLSYGTVNGKLNGISTALNTQIFFYNKDIYNSYGLDIPSDWDDLFEAAEVMSPDGMYPLTITRKSAWLMAVAYEEQKLGKRILDDDNRLGFDRQQVTDMLDFYCELLRRKVAVPIAEIGKNDFADLKSAGMVMWISDAAYYCTPLLDSGVEVAIGDFLCADGAQVFGWYAKPTSLYCIRKDTQHPAEAAELVNFLLNSEEMAQKQGLEKGIPLSRSAQEVLEANDMLAGIQFDAHTKLVREPRMTSIAPLLENDSIVSAFEELSGNVIYNNADINEQGSQLYDVIAATVGAE
ncbi:MAG: carbohydrate ABC transporter substrate-binding protein [Ruminococcus sp.]|nr:carbohydrate ABC transporter substrate-binding protein [Ruminococcus sp.]